MLRPLFAGCVLILLLLTFSLQFIDRGDPTFPIAVMTLVPTLLVMIAIVVLSLTGWESHWE